MIAQEWRLLIPAAATWLLVAGRTIYEHCLDSQSPMLGENDRSREEWVEGQFSLQRWSCWKERLRTFTERRDFSDECREYSAHTVAEMNEIEMEIDIWTRQLG